MPLFESESLVLKSYSLSEADRIVVFFTREHGIIRGVAKGAKRLKSRYGSSLEPFSTVNLTYFQKEDRELVAIEQVELLRSLFTRASDPDTLSAFSYFADLLTSFAPPHDPNETLYRMVNACIDGVCEDREKLPSIRFYFELWLLRLSGYLPDWSRCAGCRRTLIASDDAGLTIDFHLRCSDCRRSSAGMTMSGLHRKIFAGALKMPPAVFAAEYASDPEVEVLSSVMRRIVEQIIGREVKGSAVAVTSK